MNVILLENESSDFSFLMFALKNICFLLAKHDSGELRCPATALIFFLSNFETLKYFVTLFSGTVRPRSLKLGTHMDSGQMYCVQFR